MALLAGFGGAGCGLILDLDPPDVPPTAGALYRCTATVGSADGFRRALSSDDAEFACFELFTCTDCAGPCLADTAAVRGAFRALVAQRVVDESICPLPAGGASDFELYAAPWCEAVEVECVEVGAVPSGAGRTCPALPAAPPLATCPPAPPGSECLDVSPPSLDFTALACDTSTPQAVTVANCADATPLAIRVSDTPLDDPGEAGDDSDDFTVALNDCRPTPMEVTRGDDRTLPGRAVDPPGSQCTVEVTYAPGERGRHRAELVIASDAGEQRVALGGNAEGGQVEVTPTDLCIVDVAPAACVDLSVTVSNPGPGCLQILEVMVGPAPNFFRVVMPGTDPRGPLAPGAMVTIPLRYCNAGGDRDGRIQITTDDPDPADVTVVVPMRAQATCP